MITVKQRLYMDAARNAKLSVPADPSNYEKQEFPHFYVFVTMQRARPKASKATIYANAKVVATFDAADVLTNTLYHFTLAGFDLSPAEKRK